MRASQVQRAGIPPFALGQTVVLWHCTGRHCPHADTTVLAGTWTLAQVRGEPEPGPVTGGGHPPG